MKNKKIICVLMILSILISMMGCTKKIDYIEANYNTLYDVTNKHGNNKQYNKDELEGLINDYINTCLKDNYNSNAREYINIDGDDIKGDLTLNLNYDDTNKTSEYISQDTRKVIRELLLPLSEGLKCNITLNINLLTSHPTNYKLTNKTLTTKYYTKNNEVYWIDNLIKEDGSIKE